MDWSEIIDGTAVGPQNAVLADGYVTVTALWSDTGGVTVHLVADAELDREAVKRLCRTLRRLLDIEPPQ